MTKANAPRPDLVPTSSQGLFEPLNAKSGPPHDSTSSLRPRSIPGRGRGRGGNLVPSSSPSAKFAANTCPKCGHTTIAGLWKGLRVDLEPTVLTDLDEAHAIRDGVLTYNFHDPTTVTPRFLIAITSPTLCDRHAQHRCGVTYGTLTRTAPRTRTTPTTDEPPF